MKQDLFTLIQSFGKDIKLKMDSMEISSDYTEDDAYDWDRYDPRQYCHHGSFIGSWWGPDILCSSCEFGDDPTLNEMLEPLWVKKKILVEREASYTKGIIESIIIIKNQEINGALKDKISYELLNKIDEMSSFVKADALRVEDDIQKIIEEYGPFCSDRANDREVLYKKHRKEINDFLNIKEEEDEYDGVL